jgi:hypothetical protein
MTFSPCRTKARLTPIRGATSATVASATRSSIAIRSGPACPPARKLAVRLDQHQEHHPRRAKMRQAAVFVLPVRVHDGHGRRAGSPAPRWWSRITTSAALGRRDRFMAKGCRNRRTGSGHARRQARPSRGRSGHSLRRSGRGCTGWHQPEMPQPGDQKRGRRPAVDVVIGKDRDPFAGVHCPQDSRSAAAGAMSRRDRGSGKRSRRVGVRKAAHLGRRRCAPPGCGTGPGAGGFLRHASASRSCPGIGADPAAPGQRLFDIQEGRGIHHAPRGAAKARAMQEADRKPNLPLTAFSSPNILGGKEMVSQETIDVGGEAPPCPRRRRSPTTRQRTSRP